MSIVAKIGGTSVATADQLRKVQGIVQSDANIRVVVPSAPGKAHKEDTKVTDLLYLAHELAVNRQDVMPVWSKIEQRFHDIASALKLMMGYGSQHWMRRVKKLKTVQTITMSPAVAKLFMVVLWRHY